MISDIRSYFKAKIKEVMPDIKEHNHPTSFDNIPDTRLEDWYFLGIKSTTTEQQHTTIIDTVEVEIKLFIDGNNNPMLRYDLGYCKAGEIRLNLTKRSNALSAVNPIKNIICNSITPENVSEDDNTFIFTLQFQVELHQSII